MKSSLDDQKNYLAFDPTESYNSLASIADQYESSWHDSQFINLGFDTESIKNIIFVGMGGSNLSAHVIQSLAPFLLKVPFEIISNYRLPIYASKETLVILTSYSGNTEEVLSCAQDVLKRECQKISITTGGKLKDWSIQNHASILVLDEKLNRSNIPRFGLGLLLGATIGLMVRLNPESFRFVDTKEIIRTIKRTLETLGKDRDTEINPAKLLAQKNKGQGIIIISANHLTGVGKITSNYLNETSKSFSACFTIPDLNHHFLEGLSFPTTLKDNNRFILLNSINYPDVIKKRLEITKDILIKQNYQITIIKPESTDPISEVFESMVFLTLFSYYLSIVNKQNPATNPWVDLFKKQLI